METVRTFILVILVLYCLYTIYKWCVIFMKTGMSSRGLEIYDPPMEVISESMGKSTFEARIHSSAVSKDKKISFETAEVKSISIGIPEEARLEPTLVSLGDPRKKQPSSLYWKGGKFELHICFIIHNNSPEIIKLDDVNAHVYHVSMYRLRPGLMIWAPKVELAMDNTADLSSIPNSLEPGEAQPIHLVFETSTFDTLFTTIVFGLTLNYTKCDLVGHTPI